MNSFLFVGRLSSEVEIKEVGDNKIVGTFNIAVRNKRKKGEAFFYRITVWDKLAELCREYLKVGSTCAVSGEVISGSYLKEDDKQEYFIKFNANDVEFLDKKENNVEN